MWLLALFACTDPFVRPPPPEMPMRADKLVVVVLDGVRVEDTFGEGVALDGSATESLLPNTRATLFPQAARVVPGVQMGATSTTPAHCDLLAGRSVLHGHFNIRDSEGVGDYLPEWPTFIQEFLAADSTRTALITGDTPHTEGLVGTSYPGMGGEARFENTARGGLATEDDVVAVDTLVAHLTGDAPPDFVLVNLHAMDTRAHEQDEAGYVAGIRAMDEQLLRIRKTLDHDPDYAGRTLLVVTSDHGRHSTGAEYWSDHGDLCTGCRQIPILLYGPGVKEGVSLTTPYALVDLAPTAAHLLGVPMPFAEGLVMDQLLEDAAGASVRSGFVEPEGQLAAVELLAEPAHRSRVVVDGVEISAPDALEARGPTGVAGSNLLCWREIASAGEEYWPWQARCAEETDTGWVDATFPATRVDPWWRPALAPVGGDVWAAWSDNPGGGVAKDDGPPEPVQLARRVDGAWQTATTVLSGYFPTAPALAPVGDGAAVLAFVASDTPARGRYTRKVRVYRVDWAAGEPTLSAETSWELDDTGIGRQERPAVWSDGPDSQETVELAFLGYGGGTSTVLLARSADGGRTWSTPEVLAGEGRVLPHVAPVWDVAGRLWWGALGDDGGALACVRAREEDTGATVSCQPVGSARIAGMGPAGAGVRVSVDRGVGQWEIVALE